MRSFFRWLLWVEQVLFGDWQVPAGIGRLRHQQAAHRGTMEWPEQREAYGDGSQ